MIIENKDNKLIILAELSNRIEFNQELREIILKQYPGKTISYIYSLSALIGYSSLSCFLQDSTSIYYPKQIDDELNKLASNYRDRIEDEAYQAANKKGLLHEFTQEKLDSNIQILLFNPDEKRKYFSLRVGYFLLNEGILYCYGSSNGDLLVTPIEKMVWDFIQNRKIKVNKIVFSQSYTDTQSYFMSFEDLDTRIKLSNAK